MWPTPTKPGAIFHKLSYWFYQKVQTFSDNLTPKSWLYLSYIWRYDILWSKPFKLFTEVQCEKKMVKVYILHWHQCRKILRMHHLMHKTIINQHQIISVASILSKDYKNTNTSNFTFFQYACPWNFNDLYVVVIYRAGCAHEVYYALVATSDMQCFLEEIIEWVMKPCCAQHDAASA